MHPNPLSFPPYGHSSQMIRSSSSSAALLLLLTAGTASGAQSSSSPVALRGTTPKRPLNGAVAEAIGEKKKQPSVRNRRPTTLVSGGRQITWTKAARSCLWDEEEQERQKSDGTMKMLHKDTLDDCRWGCIASKGCSAVHWFPLERRCMLFDNTCDVKKTGSGRNKEQWDKLRKPEWWDSFVGPNEVWALVLVTETQSASLSVSLPSLTVSKSGSGSVSYSLPDATITETLEQETESGSSSPPWAFLPVPVAEGIALMSIIAVATLVARRLCVKREKACNAERYRAVEADSDTELGAADCKSRDQPLTAPARAQSPPSRWERGRFLGRGSYGEVHLAMATDSCFRMAVKTVRLPEGTTESQLRCSMHEVEVLSELQHPRIVQCYGCRFDQSTRELQLFMEYMEGGSLGKFVRSRKRRLAEAAAATYMQHVLEGLAYIHSKHVIHRDIKGDNILLTGQGSAKIADFGACRSIVASAKMSMCGIHGTPCWMAPEMLASSKVGRASPATDVWASGIVLCEVLDEGRVPWPAFDNPMQAMFTIAKHADDLPPDVPTVSESGQPLSDDCRCFMLRCLALKPEDRWTAESLLRHQWIVGDGRVEEAVQTTAVPVRRTDDLLAAYASRHSGSDTSSSPAFGSSPEMCSSDPVLDGSVFDSCSSYQSGTLTLSVPPASVDPWLC